MQSFTPDVKRNHRHAFGVVNFSAVNWFTDQYILKTTYKKCANQSRLIKSHTNRNLKKVTETSNDSDGEDLLCLELFSLKETDRKTIWVRFEVEGVALKMELDTGSAPSVISHKDI